MKKWKLYLSIPIILIVCILCYMTISFIRIENISINVPYGDFVIVRDDPLDNTTIQIEDILNQEKEIQQLLDNDGFDMDTFTVFNPSFVAYDDAGTAYRILIANDNFFKYNEVQVSQENTLYRFKNINNKNIILFFYEGGSSEIDTTSFKMKVENVLDESLLPEFIPQNSYILTGDYITMDTYEYIITNTPYLKNSTMDDYYIYIHTASSNDTAKIVEILKEKEYTLTASNDLSKGEDLFGPWYRNMIICIVAIVGILIVEIILIRKYRNEKGR